MIMNKAEFLLMNNRLRAFIQEKYELPMLLGMSTGRRYQRALEIECGNGHGTQLIKKNYNPVEIVAIDLDDRMIELARQNCPDQSVDLRVSPVGCGGEC